MRILVDEMPKTYFDCSFLSFDANYAHCGIPTYSWSQCYIEKGLSCPYLVKGAVACELAVEADREAEAGKAVRGDGSQMVRARGVQK